MHTRETLQNDLRAMGIESTGTVLVHSSMKSIGPVQGGADAVLDALMGYLEPGLLALPSLTWGIADQKPPVFDVLHSKPQVGILPELFLGRERVARSWHPTHSMAAYGADAEWLTAEDHLNSTPCGMRSSWRKLLDRDARILMIGCGLTSCTFIHGVEEWCNTPNRLGEAIAFTVIPPHGSPIEVVSSPHMGSPSEQYGRAEHALRERGALVDARFGDAPVQVLCAQRGFEALQALLRDNPGLFDEG